MTIKEAERLRLLKNHADGTVSLIEVSNLLNISYRHTKRIWHNFKMHGSITLVSRKYNNQNRSLDPDLEEHILSIIKEHYHDYGPTLITEKLEEKHYIKVSKETIRKLMIKNGLR